MSQKADNLLDLVRQSKAAESVTPEVPSLAAITKGHCHPELQAAFEKYDEQMRAHNVQKQVPAVTSS